MERTLRFGPSIVIPAAHVFYRSTHFAAFVNLKPVVAGHVLVAPLRPDVKRYSELRSEELAELGRVSRLIGNCIERVYSCSALTFLSQDGVAAGQTVAHWHQHIMGRTEGDYEGDELYAAIEAERRERSSEEMARQAELLRIEVRRSAVEDAVLEEAQQLTAELMKDVAHHHGIWHVTQVLRNCINALRYERLEFSQRVQVLLASLTHDADDRKLFNTENNANARRIVQQAVSKGDPSGEVLGEAENVAQNVSELIDLVSASKNKNKTVAANERWKLLPRFCDRLEAIGKIGVVRCYQYAREKGNPYFTDSTPRVINEDELSAVAPPERFAKYNGDSDSMIDHFYDKLIHLSVGDTSNTWLKKEEARRRGDLLDFLFHFGKTGELDMEYLKDA